jgi:hypothetical protein
MSAIASEPIHLGTHPAAWNRVAVHENGVRSDDAVLSRTAAVTTSRHVRAIALHEDLDHSFSTWSWTTLRDDGVILLGIVWSIPVAVLVIGTAVALAIAFLLWLVRLTLHAF